MTLSFSTAEGLAQHRTDLHAPAVSHRGGLRGTCAHWAGGVPQAAARFRDRLGDLLQQALRLGRVGFDVCHDPLKYYPRILTECDSGVKEIPEKVSVSTPERN